MDENGNRRSILDLEFEFPEEDWDSERTDAEWEALVNECEDSGFSLEAWDYCKHCERPVFRAIEGELVCDTCWQRLQMTEDELAAEEEIATFQEWAATHCEDCGRRLKGGGVCPKCQEERGRIEAELWPDDVDWGDGSLSPEAEERKAALDHKGRP